MTNQKTFILLSGLPASGKDAAADFFREHNFKAISFSSEILIPITNNPSILHNLINQTPLKIPKENINSLISLINKTKQTQKGRKLLITLGVKILPPFIQTESQNKYTHFNLLAKPIFDKEEKIVIASFRMPQELQTIKALYPQAKIITILIHTDDDIRYDRIKIRDELDEETIIKNEKYEKETTYNYLLKNIDFNFIIENNSTLKEFEEKLNEILQKLI